MCYYRKVGDLSSSAMDKYMNFCERVLVSLKTEEEDVEEDVECDEVVDECLGVVCAGAKIVGVTVDYLSVLIQAYEARLVQK